MQISQRSRDPAPDFASACIPPVTSHVHPLCRHEVICAAFDGGYQNDHLLEYLCDCREVRQ
jgi:hypothetical protein